MKWWMAAAFALIALWAGFHEYWLLVAFMVLCSWICSQIGGEVPPRP